MKNSRLAAAAMILALGLGSRAHADEILSFSVSGDGISASGTITYALDTISGDPDGANNMVSISGSFSDSNAGISNANITGLVSTEPNAGNAPYATSLTRVPVGGTLLPANDSNSLTFDNLLYPGGSPDTCFDGITGGYFDVFGTLFTLDNGDEVNLWSDGGGSNDSPIYGIAVAEPTGVVDGTTVYTAIDYVGDGISVVPEPSSFWLLGVALLGALGLTRRQGASRGTMAG